MFAVDFLVFGNSKNKKIIATIYENTEKGGNVMLSNCNFYKLLCDGVGDVHSN